MFTAICSNTSFFPGEDGVPSLPVFTPEPGELVSVYGNVNGKIAFNLILTNVNANVSITSTSIISKPNFYNVTKISETNYRFVQNDIPVFVGESMDFVLFDNNGNVTGTAEENVLPPNTKKTPYNYTAPPIKEILATTVIRYVYMETQETGPPIEKNETETYIQTHFWNWRISINKLTNYISQGDY